MVTKEWRNRCDIKNAEEGIKLKEAISWWVYVS
jgi:hypothetical protein